MRAAAGGAKDLGLEVDVVYVDACGFAQHRRRRDRRARLLLKLRAPLAVDRSRDRRRVLDTALVRAN
jgi:hypothetical protein